MKVKFTRAWWVGGYPRFRKGRTYDIPPELISQLPKTGIQVIEETPVTIEHEPKEAPTAPQIEIPEGGEKPKMYAGVQAFFKSESGANVTKEEVLNTSFKEFIAESPGNDVEAWNSLTQDERKTRMKSTAEIILRTL